MIGNSVNLLVFIINYNPPPLFLFLKIDKTNRIILKLQL